MRDGQFELLADRAQFPTHQLARHHPSDVQLPQKFCLAHVQKQGLQHLDQLRQLQLNAGLKFPQLKLPSY
jgi:hypothetical protein